MPKALNADLLAECTRETHLLLHERLPLGAGEHIDEDLMGACAIGAFALMEVLYREGVRGARAVHFNSTGIWVGEHWWVHVGVWALDPTYEQFDHKRPWLCLPRHPMMGPDARVGARLPDSWPAECHPRTFWPLLGFGAWP